MKSILINLVFNNYSRLSFLVALFFSQSLYAQFFLEQSPSIIQGVSDSRIANADVDGDGDIDFVLQGNSTSGAVTTLYLNNGCGFFGASSSSGIDNLVRGSVDLADIDGDGDQDLISCGRETYNGTIKTYLYLNNGSGIFSIVSTPFDDMYGIVKFIHLDNQNGIDVFIGGYDGNDFINKIYLNNGSGSFTEVTGTPFSGKYADAANFADIDGDGDKDYLFSNSSEAITYLNHGNGIFTVKPNPTISPVYVSTINFADIDNDFDMDLLMTGVDNSSGYDRTCRFYINDGSGNFTLDNANSFVGVQSGSVDFYDIEQDGDLDFAITGSTTNSPYRQTKVYINNGSGIFSQYLKSTFTAVQGGTATFFDITGDGLKDLFVSGYTGSPGNKSKFYINVPSEKITACDSYPWIDGVTYTSSNQTPTHTITGGGINGCDLIKNLDLTIEHSANTTDYVITEESTFTWIDGNTYNSSNSNAATYTVSNSEGCSNQMTLNLTLNSTGINQEDEPEFKWVQHVEETTTDPSCVWPYTIHSTFMNNGDIVLFSRGPGNINGTCPVLIGGQEVSNVDGFLARISKNGQLIWAKSEGEIGGPVSKITTDDANNIYCYQNLSPINQIKKLDSNGNELGTFNLQGKHANINSFFVKNSSIYLAGMLSKYIYDNDPVIFGLPIPTSRDALVAKINSTTGVVEFAGSVEGAGSSVVGGMDLDAQGNIYIGGDFNSTNDFDLGAGTQLFDAPFGSYYPEFDQSGTVYLAKYNVAFELQWVKQFRTSGTSVQRVEGLKKDPTGSFIYLAGEYRSTIDLDPSAGSTVFNTNSKLNFFFAKYDLSGNLIWGKDAGEDENDHLEALDIDNSGNLLLGGSTNVRPFTHPTNPSWTIAKADIEIQKYRGSDGVLTWKKSFTSEYSLNLTDDRNSIRGLSSTANGGFVAVGTFTRTMDFDDGVSYANKTFNSSNGNGLSGHDLFFMSYGNISPCPENLALTSPANDITTGTIELEVNSTTGYINAANKLSNGTNTIYRGGRYIQLEPGFTANSGAIFKTEFGGCEE